MSKRLLLLLVLVAVAWYLWNGPLQAPLAEALSQAVEVRGNFDADVSIDRPPVQNNLANPPVLRVDDFAFTLLADFQLEARVLGRRDYRRDAGADLAPIDLALGWGPMARPEVVEQIDISQRGRFYFWEVDRYPIERAAIINNSANMHLIPASPEVFSELKRAEADRQIRLRGFLVNVDREDGWRWRSSTTRSDSGNGACELILVTAAQVF
ncbi:MAG: hypothetical protein V2J10_10895 [Wenzhouxiangella sp.]|jgi:hypothetical protein|nr:hypothetical protein [Wenzhouxiangella sp.]